MLPLSDGHPTLPQRSWALVLQCCMCQSPRSSGSPPGVHPEVLELWKHRVVWVGRDLEDPLVPISLPWAGLQANVGETRKPLSPVRGEKEESQGNKYPNFFCQPQLFPHTPLSDPEIPTGNYKSNIAVHANVLTWNKEDFDLHYWKWNTERGTPACL